MQLRYFVPFKAQEGVNAQFALKEKLINIEGVAIDTSVNSNKWQVPQEDLDVLSESLVGAQVRVDHAESALMVVGKVSEAKRDGGRVLFCAEVGEEKLIEKILRKYVTHVSIQVDSDDVECSKCKQPTRSEGMLIHLCPGAWEIVHKPKVRELSIVASPAYENTAFKPVGFGAAMDSAQIEAVQKRCAGCTCPSRILGISQLSQGNKDGGSKDNLQEPDDKNLKAQEVKHLSEHNAQKNVSPYQAQGVVNTAPPESQGLEEDYMQLMNQLQSLSDAVKSCGGSGNEMAAIQKQIDDLQEEVAKKATKRSMSKKISDLQKQLQQPDDDGDGEDAEASKAEGKAQGKGIVATDEMALKDLGNYGWFKDILKANRKLTPFQ